MVNQNERKNKNKMIKKALRRMVVIIIGGIAAAVAVMLCSGCANGNSGQRGESAYEIAVRHGFEGTEREWLKSLHATNDTTPDASQSEEETSYPAEAGYTSVSQTVYATSPVNVRTKPATEDGSAVVGQLQEGERVLRIGINPDTGWCRIVYQDEIRYVSGRYLELTVSDTVVDLGATAPVLLLPSSITVTVGEPYTLYHDAYISGLSDTMFVSCNYHGGKAETHTQRDCYTLTEKQAGEYTLDIIITQWLNGAPTKIAQQSVLVVAVEPNTQRQLCGMMIGDSRVADGTMLSALQTKLGSRLTWIGTRTTALCASEGRSGWSTMNYLYYEKVGTLVNPFYSPNTQVDEKSGISHHFDFSYYMKNTGAKTPDFVIFCLGANDGYTAAAAERLRIMADSVQAYGRSIGKDIAVLVMTEYFYPTTGYDVSKDYDVAASRYAQLNFNRYLTDAFADLVDEEKAALLSNYLVLNATTHRVRSQVDQVWLVTDPVHLSYEGYMAQSAVILSELYRWFG